MGKKSCTKGACGLAAGRPNFAGEGCKKHRARTRPARAPKRSAGHRCQRARKAPRFCCISAIVFATMAGMAKALEIALRSVNTASLRGAAGCGPLPWPASGLRAGHSWQKRLAKELSGRRSSVHSGVRYIQCQDLAASALRLSLGVEITIAASYQGRTQDVGMDATAFVPWAITSGQNKSRHRRLLHRKIIGTGIEALAMFDIHEIFCLCNYGTRRNQAAGAGLRAGLLVRDAVAVGADIPSLLYGQFNTFIARLQRVSLTFV